MRKWLWVLVGLMAVWALGHYLAKHDPTNPYLSLSADKIIAQAQALDRRWAESNSPVHKGYILIEKREAEHTRAALQSIKPGNPQVAEARRLLASLQRREDEGKKAMQAAIAKSLEDNVEGRTQFVRKLETDFLKSGMDVRLTTSGAKATILNFRYVLVNRPFLYKLANESPFLANAKHAGFTRVHFTDGYSASANYDLRQDKFE